MSTELVSADASAVSTKSSDAVAMLMIGMAGSGKTTLVQRINAELRARKEIPYLINLDPAVMHVPYGPNIDIRDTVNYKEVMTQYGLGPNGAIVTALNLYSTRFDQVVDLIKQKVDKHDYFIVDTPGQIEVFTWSASGALITDMMCATLPSVLVYVMDTPRSKSPATFMANMLYACSILYKTRLPLVVVLNKSDITPADFAIEWMEDFQTFEEAIDEENKRNESYSNTLTRSLSLALDEFYSNMRAVAVSAATGEGMDELFQAIKEASQEFKETAALEREAAAVAKAEDDLARETADLERLSIDSVAPDKNIDSSIIE